MSSPQVVQFLGWRDQDTGKTFPVKHAARLREWKALPGPLGETAGTKFGRQRLLPVFSTRKAETKVTLQPGEALLVGALLETEDVHSLKSPASSHRLMAVISARVIDANGQAPRPAAPADSRASNSQISQKAIDRALFGGNRAQDPQTPDAARTLWSRERSMSAAFHLAWR
jgi:hypothetical protein